MLRVTGHVLPVTVDLSQVVCNLTAALSFTNGALYCAKSDLATMHRCALLPAITGTDLGLSLLQNCLMGHQQIKAPSLFLQNPHPSCSL